MGHGAPVVTHIAETFNEYGTPVSMFRCGGCETTFTVCPAVPEDQRDQWTGCMAETCSTYDEGRDGDKLFDAGKVRRVGDRSHLKAVQSAPPSTCGIANGDEPKTLRAKDSSQ